MDSFVVSSESRKRILFIDAFDPFTEDLVDLLKDCLNVEVTVVQMNDTTVESNFAEICSIFNAVVVGPGSGHLANERESGLIGKLWTLNEAHILPVLGICLGFQSLCHSYGAEIEELQDVREDIIGKATHTGADLFSGVDEIRTTRYHLVRVNLGQLTSINGSVGYMHWEPTLTCPLLKPLAWDTGDGVNGPILLAVRHTTRPFWGAQLHPDFISTSKPGRELITNWWREAVTWLSQRNPGTNQENVKRIAAEFRFPESPIFGNLPYGKDGFDPVKRARETAGTDNMFLRWGKHQAISLSPTNLLEALHSTQQEVVLLDSQSHEAGRYSIIGLVVPGRTMNITYKASTRSLAFGFSANDTFTTQLGSIEDVWPILQGVLDVYNPRHQRPGIKQLALGLDTSRLGMNNCIRGHLPTESPFWGGFMGYISYEAGLETIGVNLPASYTDSDAPDINFAFIHRSIVIDHVDGQAYTQTLLPGDWQWILDIGKVIKEITSPSAAPPPPPPIPTNIRADDHRWDISTNAIIRFPSETEYRGKVLDCQKLLASGDLHGLYLADESKITVPCSSNGTGVNAWALYEELRHTNPSSFSAFLRLSNVIVAGSSPEEFLSWARRERDDPMDQDVPRGFDILSKSLPPNSMTGEPKKHACEVLRDVEKRPRGVYSGILGYLDIGGAGEFAVVTRAAVRGNKSTDRDHGTDAFETWQVGAGAAITTDITDEDAFLEMESAASSVVAAFLRSEKG